MPFKILYKCRLCGEIFECGTWFGDVLGDRVYKDDNKNERHVCESGDVGIGDIIGFKPTGH